MYVKKAIVGTLTGITVFSMSWKQNPDQADANPNWDESNAFFGIGSMTSLYISSSSR